MIGGAWGEGGDWFRAIAMLNPWFLKDRARVKSLCTSREGALQISVLSDITHSLLDLGFLHICTWHKITNWFYLNLRPLKPIIGLETLENLHIIFCIFAYFHIFLLHFCIFVYILRIFFLHILYFYCKIIFKLYNSDLDWRFNISSRCSLFCATAELKDTHWILRTLSKIY